MEFKDTGWVGNKKDVSITERVIKGGVTAVTTRRCLYFITDRKRIDSPVDLAKIAEENLTSGKKNFHVLKERNSIEGIDRLMCKVAGTFLSMVDEYLYNIKFVHTFKISFICKSGGKEVQNDT